MFAMWHSTRSLDGGNEIGFLLSESERVFNHSSFKIGKGLRLDGPYGRNIDLGNYESVILAAKGMGIAGILSSALFLLDRHNLDTLAKKEQMSFDEDGAIRYTNRIFRDQTRKIVLIWILEDNCQEDWAAAQIRDLQKIDTQAVCNNSKTHPSKLTVKDTSLLVHLPIRGNERGSFSYRQGLAMSLFQKRSRREILQGHHLPSYPITGQTRRYE